MFLVVNVVSYAHRPLALCKSFANVTTSSTTPGLARALRDRMAGMHTALPSKLTDEEGSSLQVICKSTSSGYHTKHTDPDVV